MVKSKKVAISLPERVLLAVEEQRRAKGESRSEFFRHAVEKFLKQEQESRDVENYVQGYCNLPESREEVEAAHRAGVAVLAREPW
jgi:metal-responsive CopG/Arc/MetJ family transcriptional regulator